MFEKIVKAVLDNDTYYSATEDFNDYEMIQFNAIIRKSRYTDEDGNELVWTNDVYKKLRDDWKRIWKDV